MAAELASRFAWVTTTPFGSPVEPDVYWRKATSSPRTPESTQSAAASVTTVSTAIHVVLAAASSPRSAVPIARIADVVRIASAPESARMRRMPATPWRGEAGFGG